MDIIPIVSGVSEHEKAIKRTENQIFHFTTVHLLFAVMFEAERCDYCDAKVFAGFKLNPGLQCFRINCQDRPLHRLEVSSPQVRLGIPICCQCYSEVKDQCKAVKKLSRQIEVMGTHPLTPWDENCDIGKNGREMHIIHIMLRLLEGELLALKSILIVSCHRVITDIALETIKNNIELIESQY